MDAHLICSTVHNSFIFILGCFFLLRDRLLPSGRGTSSGKWIHVWAAPGEDGWIWKSSPCNGQCLGRNLKDFRNLTLWDSSACLSSRRLTLSFAGRSGRDIESSKSHLGKDFQVCPRGKKGQITKLAVDRKHMAGVFTGIGRSGSRGRCSGHT